MALGESGEPAGVPLLERILDREDRTSRLLTIRALGKIGDDAARAILLRLRTRPDLSREEGVFVRSALK